VSVNSSTSDWLCVCESVCMGREVVWLCVNRCAPGMCLSEAGCMDVCGVHRQVTGCVCVACASAGCLCVPVCVCAVCTWRCVRLCIVGRHLWLPGVHLHTYMCPCVWLGVGLRIYVRALCLCVATGFAWLNKSGLWVVACLACGLVASLVYWLLALDQNA